MRKSLSRGIYACLAVALGAAGPAKALCLQPSPVRVCTEFFRSEYVVTAKILSSRKIPDTPDPNNVEGWFYKVQVERTYRGGKLPSDEIYTGNDETKFAMDVGKSYLLFINANLQSRLQPDTCGNSAELSKAKAATDAVEAILKAAGKGGDIAGRVMLPVGGSQAMSEAGAPGIQLVVKNYVGRDQPTTTDKDGNFKIHVGAGHYSVVGASDVWNVVPYSLAYMKPTDFDLQDGGCADLMFLAQPK
jgi:hypothetical protein